MYSELKINQHHQYIVIKFSGEITSVDVVSYRIKLNTLINQTKKDLIFDFKDVSLIDSSGIGLILGRYNLLKGQNRRLILCHLNPVCYKIFELTGLFSIMPYISSLDELKEGVYE